MFRPITTLDLSSLMITELHKKGYFYVEDLESDLDNLEKIGLDKSNVEKQLKLDEKLALDVWQNETQQGSLSLCCSELETILQNGFQCRNITELSGASFTGKTQICMQLCISVQLNKHYGGLNGRAIYIDTRCGPVLMRFRGRIILFLLSYIHFVLIELFEILLRMILI